MKIAFVTTNEGKYAEISRMLEDRGHEAEHIPISYPEVQADSLEMVAIQGILWLMDRYDRPILIDDSGLFIDSLKDFPGIYSSFVFSSIGCDGILDLMRGVENRSARFECCLGFRELGKDPVLFKENSEGTISAVKRGEKGFGFDPIFIPSGYDKTFAEMAIDQKNELSHRGKALREFFEYIG